MDYPSYRARGLQVGSGTIESTCKHLISARLKQAGMIWSETGAEAVSTVRAWLKSGRWGAAMALRQVPQRCYRRRVQEQATGAKLEEQAQGTRAAPEAAPPASTLSGELLARVQAELAQEQASYSWHKPWSIRQQRRQAEARLADATLASAA
jgi:hypothetical protein